MRRRKLSGYTSPFWRCIASISETWSRRLSRQLMMLQTTLRNDCHWRILPMICPSFSSSFTLRCAYILPDTWRRYSPSRRYFNVGELTPFKQLSGMLRLSTKYLCDQLRQAVITHLMIVYPRERAKLLSPSPLIPTENKDDTVSLPS